MSLNWRQYYIRKWCLIIFILITFIGFAILSNYISEKYLSFAVLLWMALAGIPLAFRFGACSCPNCGRPIHIKGLFGFPFSPKCLHCGIKIGQKESE